MYGLIKRNKDLFGMMSEMFDDFSTGVESWTHGYPKINTYEDDSNYKVDVYYPGMKKEDFKVNVENKVLSIRSSFSDKKEDTEKYHFKEFSKREFCRSFSLPDEIVKSKIAASYEDGVLKIVIPKDKAKEKQSKFQVNIE